MVQDREALIHILPKGKDFVAEGSWHRANPAVNCDNEPLLTHEQRGAKTQPKGAIFITKSLTFDVGKGYTATVMPHFFATLRHIKSSPSGDIHE